MKQPMLIQSSAYKVGRDTEQSGLPEDPRHRKAYDKADALICLECLKPNDWNNCLERHKKKGTNKCQKSTAPLDADTQTPIKSFQ